MSMFISFSLWVYMQLYRLQQSGNMRFKLQMKHATEMGVLTVVGLCVYEHVWNVLDYSRIQQDLTLIVHKHIHVNKRDFTKKQIA